MKKKLLKALFFTIISLNFLNAQAFKDFETGIPSVSGLTFRNQHSIDFSILDCEITPLFGSVLTPGFSGYDIPYDKASIVTLGNFEPILEGYGIIQDVVGPNGGKCAMRLNDVISGGSDISSFEYSFMPTDSFLSFDYMLVLDSGHIDELDVQPFFTARLLDDHNNIIQSTQFCIVADPDEPILLNNSDKLFYTDGWYCGLIMIPEEYLGKEIKLQFITADCGVSGHRGVAYIDNIVNEKKCENPQYGYVNLDHLESECSPPEAYVCGTFMAPLNSVFSDIEFGILQNGLPLNIPAGAITLELLTGNAFCFRVNFEAISMSVFLNGNYEFRAQVKFVSTTNGYTYYLSDESTNAGADVSFIGAGLPLKTYIDYDNQTISWPANGGPYYVEFSADSACCPKNGSNDPPGATPGSLVTYNNTISFHDGFMAVKRKCLRFRIRAKCTPWTQWCCITTYTVEDAGYVNPRNGDSYDCVEELDMKGMHSEETYVYPNATTGAITIKNANSLKFELYDYSNNLVLSKEIPIIQQQVVLDLSDLKQGIYILKTDKGQSIKVVKN